MITLHHDQTNSFHLQKDSANMTSIRKMALFESPGSIQSNWQAPR